MQLLPRERIEDGGVIVPPLERDLEVFEGTDGEVAAIVQEHPAVPGPSSREEVAISTSASGVVQPPLELRMRARILLEGDPVLAALELLV